MTVGELLDFILCSSVPSSSQVIITRRRRNKKETRYHIVGAEDTTISTTIFANESAITLVFEEKE